MNHLRSGNLVRKDQARRLRYQEKQRLLQRAEKDLKKSDVLGHCEPSKGTLEVIQGF